MKQNRNKDVCKIYCVLTGKYFRLVSIVILNFQIVTHCRVLFGHLGNSFLHMILEVQLRASSLLFSTFCRNTDIGFVCVSITCCLFIYTLLGFLPQPEQCNKQHSPLLSCHIFLKMEEIPSCKINVNKPKLYNLLESCFEIC